MMRSVGIVLAVIVLILGGFLGYVTTKPDSFAIERSIQIQAPPEAIFPMINDLHLWEKWSPWDKMDPAMKRSYTGSEMGTGAIYEWEGNKKVGKGRMEIVESNAPNNIGIKLDFISPFEAHNMTEFIIESADNVTTTVTWKMTGPNPFMSKLMQTFMDMDKMIGKDFETGLASLKALSEE